MPREAIPRVRRWRGAGLPPPRGTLRRPRGGPRGRIPSPAARPRRSGYHHFRVRYSVVKMSVRMFAAPSKRVSLMMRSVRDPVFRFFISMPVS